MDSFKLQIFFDAYKRLSVIAEQLQRLDKYYCERDLSEREEKRKKRLESEAEEIAEKVFGLHALHQGDPQKASLFLVRTKKEASTGLYNAAVRIG